MVDDIPRLELGAEPSRFSLRRWFYGLIVTQGLHFSLVHLAISMTMLFDPASLGESWNGLVLLLVARSIAIFFGSLLSAAGQPMGVLAGLLSGAISVASMCALDVKMGRLTDHSSTLIVGAIAAMAVSLVGSLVGRLIWKPLPRLLVPGMATSRAVKPDSRLEVVNSGLWMVVRASIGVAILAFGTLEADTITKAIARFAGMNAVSLLQLELVTWTISALAAMAAGGATGINSRSGFVGGLWVGAIGAVVVLVGQNRMNKVILPAHEFWLTQGTSSGTAIASTIFGGLSCLFLATLGGWVGSQLMPPLGNKRKLHSPG